MLKYRRCCSSLAESVFLSSKILLCFLYIGACPVLELLIDFTRFPLMLPLPDLFTFPSLSISCTIRELLSVRPLSVLASGLVARLPETAEFCSSTLLLLLAMVWPLFELIDSWLCSSSLTTVELSTVLLATVEPFVLEVFWLLYREFEIEVKKSYMPRPHAAKNRNFQNLTQRAAFFRGYILDSFGGFLFIFFHQCLKLPVTVQSVEPQSIRPVIVRQKRVFS